MSKTTLFTHKHDERCPKCAGELVIRSGAHGPFQGCSNYPDCDYVHPLKPNADGHIVKVLEGQNCPECDAMLVLRQGKFGMFIGCNNYPDCKYIASMSEKDETSIACPKCRKGRLLQRKSRFGKVFYACDCYPSCQFALNNKPVPGVCAHCSYPLLMEKRTAQGIKLFCANKLCGKKAPTE